jgi:GNAT superfamily N-acetyltransferase
MSVNSIDISEALPFSTDVSATALWLSNTWIIDLGYTLSETENWLNELAETRTEALFVGKLDDRIVGTVIVCDCDLEGYEHLTPWISSLFVQEEFRGRNFGGQLLKKASNWARRQSHKDLFLYTDKGKLIKYYNNFGWRSVQDVVVNGDACQIMKKTFTDFSHIQAT